MVPSWVWFGGVDVEDACRMGRVRSRVRMRCGWCFVFGM